MQAFITYWFVNSFSRFYGGWFQTVTDLDNRIALKETAKHLTQPLFQDYSLEGRIIAVPIRSARILAGLVTYTASALVYFSLFVLWIIFPFLCLLSLVSPLFTQSSGGGL